MPPRSWTSSPSSSSRRMTTTTRRTSRPRSPRAARSSSRSASSCPPPRSSPLSRTPTSTTRIIDDWADNDFDGTVDAPNIKPLVFDTAQAAYLGGYAAASWSAQSGVNKVGTFGGMQIPSVAVFMDGYQLGVEKYNEDKSAAVEVFGWDEATQKGSFTGGFDANDTAKADRTGCARPGRRRHPPGRRPPSTRARLRRSPTAARTP